MIEIRLRSTGKAVLAARVRMKNNQKALGNSTVIVRLREKAGLSLGEWFRNSEEAGISGLSLFPCFSVPIIIRGHLCHLWFKTAPNNNLFLNQ
jgi:hypothetical protein